MKVCRYHFIGSRSAPQLESVRNVSLYLSRAVLGAMKAAV